MPLLPSWQAPMRLDRRNIFVRTLFGVTALAALTPSIGYAREMVAGIFVNCDHPGEVDMLRLVESPPGYLSGSLVISSLKTNGDRKKDDIYDVAGTISGSNVSLQLKGGLAGLAGLLGVSTNMVGSLNAGRLELDTGNLTVVYHEMSRPRYAEALANLNTSGQHIATVQGAVGAIQQTESESRQVNVDLKSYIGWANERIARVPEVRSWYAQRLDRYTKCLEIIRPQAASGVPAWRWQNCVLATQNDEYYRNEEAKSIHVLEGQNEQTVAQLNARISTALQDFPKAVSAMNAACPFTKDVNLCTNRAQKLNQLSPGGALDGKLVAQYRETLPHISEAIRTDIQLSNQGQSKLETIAQQIAKLYEEAR